MHVLVSSEAVKWHYVRPLRPRSRGGLGSEGRLITSTQYTRFCVFVYSPRTSESGRLRYLRKTTIQGEINNNGISDFESVSAKGNRQIVSRKTRSMWLQIQLRSNIRACWNLFARELGSVSITSYNQKQLRLLTTRSPARVSALMIRWERLALRTKGLIGFEENAGFWRNLN